MAHTLAANQMQVQVENNLPAVWPGVDDQPVTRLADALIHSNLFRCGEQMTNQGFILARQIIDRGNVLVGDDQYMGRGDGVEVAKSGHLFIFLHLFAGDLPC
jgi:hypothetical protein